MFPISSSDPNPVLAALGWGPDLEAAAAGLADPPAVPGRVVRVDRGRLLVRTGSDTVAVTLTGADADVCTGDWVLVRLEPDAAHSLVATLPRRSALRRAAADGESQAHILAANADAVAVVEGLIPGVNLSRVERLLVMVWSSGAEPVVLLTKADLVPDLDAVLAEVAAVAPGVAVLALSSTTGDGFEALAPYVAPGRTLALLGRSGVGKSSLCNRLLGEDAAWKQIHTDLRRHQRNRP